ncbi:MAG: tyrosine-type recombinase/integrase [Planctomycetes bacterium]|nr:tyrosine-type recombinase/integrase [Planctomycetota bacterium]
MQKGVLKAARKAELTKRVTSHTFRHSFATHLLADGKTTMIYTHVLNRGGRGVRSPAGGLPSRREER